jgi:hypothetical protein
LIASGTDENKPLIYIWEKYAKRHQEQSRDCGCNSVTVLILLNILLMVFFALLGLSGSGGQNWFNWFNKRSLETQRGPSAEQILNNAQPLLEQPLLEQPLLEQNGIDIIYL